MSGGSEAVVLGTITVTYELWENDVVVGVKVDPEGSAEFPLVTQLGALRMAEDTLLRGIDDGEGCE